MKKLLHIQLLPLMSGVQRFSLHLLDGLNPDEFEIWVACKPGGEFVDEINKRGFHYISLPTFRHPISIMDFLTFVHLLGIIKKHRFDIVHTNCSKPGLLGRLAARICRVPLIVHTSHGTAFQQDQSPVVYRFFMLMEVIGNFLGHKTIFVNNSDRLKCLAKGLVKDSKARTIYNAIPPKLQKQFTDIDVNRKMPQGDIIIGSTLRFSKQKNVLSLITCACKACKQAPNLRFIILGDGENYDLCQSIVHTNKLDERIILPGWDSDVIPWLKVFNAFVLYSRWEAMPYSIIEAMSSGLPVIGSNIPSIAELVDNDTGYLVPLDDDAALIESFVSVANDFEPAFIKGKLAAERIKQLCDYDHMVSEYRDVYLGNF